MIKFPPLLKPSDKVGIIPPASKISLSNINSAKALLESWGLDVALSSNYNSEYYIFAGTDNERRQALQEMLDDREIKCIFCARGGYGTSRIIDQLDFAPLKKNPKWIIGFSDITILLNKLFLNQIGSIHGPMPLNFRENDAEASIRILKRFLFEGTYPVIEFESVSKNKPGFAEGCIVGGNLTMLINSIGTSTHVNTKDKILFIEDIDEKLYKIDRMIVHLKRAGIFEDIKGLIVGHFSKIDNQKDFGYSISQIILSHTEKYNFPVCFGAPIGHIMPNHPVIIGKSISLEVDRHHASFSLKEQSRDQSYNDQ
jgi:muramoyltetrapeptide carboxypeptidase